MSYEAYLKKQILGPAGINTMVIGKTKKSGTAKGEVLYYSAPFAAKVTSVLASGPKEVPEHPMAVSMSSPSMSMENGLPRR